MPIRALARVARGVIAAVGAIVVSACYESPVPLGPPDQGVIDATFIGTWTCVDPKDAKNVATITTLPFDGHQLFVEWREPADHVTRYRAFATRVQDQTLYGPFATCAAKAAPAPR